MRASTLGAGGLDLPDDREANMLPIVTMSIGSAAITVAPCGRC